MHILSPLIGRKMCVMKTFKHEWEMRSPEILSSHQTQWPRNLIKQCGPEINLCHHAVWPRTLIKQCEPETAYANKQCDQEILSSYWTVWPVRLTIESKKRLDTPSSFHLTPKVWKCVGSDCAQLTARLLRYQRTQVPIQSSAAVIEQLFTVNWLKKRRK